MAARPLTRHTAARGALHACCASSSGRCACRAPMCRVVRAWLRPRRCSRPKWMPRRRGPAAGTVLHGCALARVARRSVHRFRVACMRSRAVLAVWGCARHRCLSMAALHAWWLDDEGTSNHWHLPCEMQSAAPWQCNPTCASWRRGAPARAAAGGDAEPSRSPTTAAPVLPSSWPWMLAESAPYALLIAIPVASLTFLALRSAMVGSSRAQCRALT